MVRKFCLLYILYATLAYCIIFLILCCPVQTPPEELKAHIDQAAHQVSFTVQRYEAISVCVCVYVQVSADNTELACAFIQKTAVEKAVPEIDKELAKVLNLCTYS